MCPESVTSFSPVTASRMLAVSPSRSAATKRVASGARAATCLPVPRPTPGTVDSTRELASASCRACWASVSTVPSCRRVVSAASIASKMLRSGSTSRFASADAASWRAVARRASSRASLRTTSAKAARVDAAAASTANPTSVARRLRERRRATASAPGPRLGQELALACGQGEVGRTRPCLELRESALVRQVLGMALRVAPLSDRLDEPPVEEEVLAAFLDPPAEPIPLGEDGLVRDLDGRRSSQRLAVEGE